MADQEGGVPTTNPPNQQQQQQQWQNQDQVGQQQVLHLNWSNFKPEFSGKPDKTQKHICSAQMTGWMHITLLKVWNSKGFVSHYWERQDCGTIH